MLPILPALALHAGQPDGIIVPQRPSLVMPGDREFDDLFPVLGMFPFPSPLLTVRAGAAPITLGEDDSFHTTDLHGLSDWLVGSTYQAAASGTINFLSIVGVAGGSSAVDYRLVIYASSNSTTGWGSKLGETATTNGLGVNQVKKLATLAPISIVAGNYYGLVVHQAARLDFGVDNVTAGKNSWNFTGAYASGAPATASGLASFSATNVLVWGTTV